MHPTSNFTPQLTADGSFTFFSQEFGESFHSHYGAKQEAELKFVEPTQLRQKAQQPIIYLLDICYGLGYNTAAALETIWATNPNCLVEWIGLELDPSVPPTALEHNLLNSWASPIPELLTQIGTAQKIDTPKIKANLLLGDARKTIQQVHKSGFKADAIFLDPFSPPHCPQLWTVEFLTLVAGCLNPNGLLATYSSSAAARSAMKAAGLVIGSTPPVGRRSPGTVACKETLQNPSLRYVNSLKLSEQESEHLCTRAAIPYRDPLLKDSPQDIILRRKLEQQTSPLEPTQAWKKRWLTLKDSTSRNVT